MLSLKTRSYSSTSSSSSSSSSSRADDIFDSLSVMVSPAMTTSSVADVQPQATVDIWSAGNVRVDGRDQSLPAVEAQELISALKGDERVSYHGRRS